MSNKVVLPKIDSPTRQNPFNHDFRVPLDSIDDLFFESPTEAKAEWTKLQGILHEGGGPQVMTRLYNKSLPMNRKAFGDFAYSISGIAEKHTDEIFSCATLTFGKDDLEPPDVEMNPTEFAIAFVRLANLISISEQGMDGASMLTKQVVKLLTTLTL